MKKGIYAQPRHVCPGFISIPYHYIVQQAVGAQCTVELYFLAPVSQAVSATLMQQSSTSLLFEYGSIIQTVTSITDTIIFFISCIFSHS